MRVSAKIDTNVVPPNVVFENPTIASLSSLASRFVTRSQSGAGPSPDFTTTEEDKIETMLELVSKYTQDFPTRLPNRSRVLPRAAFVLITGTTGGLGTRLLADLIACPDVSKIYAVNRRQRRSLTERQMESFRKQGLDGRIVESEKVVLIEADVSDKGAGFRDEVLDEVSHMLFTLCMVSDD